MKCARLQLRDRMKPAVKPSSPAEKPRRYCQKRLINPEHSEDPRWTDVLMRFHCNPMLNFEEDNKSSVNTPSHQEDLFLTIQNLKFQGAIQERKRPRTSFKYMSLSSDRKHRMFVKQVIDDESSFYDDRSSQLTSYYVDDYLKYIISNDRSRPSSSKSSVFLQDLTNKFGEKDTPVERSNVGNVKKIRKFDQNAKKPTNKAVKYAVEDKVYDEKKNIIDDANVAYHKSGKRKSLTISRAPSPQTIQVIRVDVVCNYSSSSTISDSDEKIQHKTDITNLSTKDLDNIKLKGSHFADKYLLTNTIKSVEENLSCGSKVTLLCKTFKLSDRGKLAERKYARTVKNSSNTKKSNRCVKNRCE